MVVVDEAFKGAGQKAGIEIWRIKKFRVIPLDPSEYGYFYSGDSYIVLSTLDITKKLYDLHFWIGSESSEDEFTTAAMKTVELDDLLGGGPVEYRELQYYESALFLSYFKNGIKYLKGGYESGFTKVAGQHKHEPRLFQCKGKRNVRCKQVRLTSDSLNLGDVFIMDNWHDIYVWCPPESGRLERTKGIQAANAIRDQERSGRSNVHVLDQMWDTHDTFWKLVGGRPNSIKKADQGGRDEDVYRAEKQAIALYRVSDASGKMEIKKVGEGDVSTNMLDRKDAFILDTATGGVFVWVGSQCTMDERKKAMQYAVDYLHLQGRPKWTQVMRVLDTAEPGAFLQWFTDGLDLKHGDLKARLFECSDETGKLLVREICKYTQEDLDGDDSMILDAGSVIYVWIGNLSNENEKHLAQETAKKYLKTDSMPRPLGSKIVTIQQNKEPQDFTKLFQKWNPSFWKKV